MKKYYLIIISFFTASVAFAMLIGRFISWDDLIEQSPEIVIARCTSTLGKAQSISEETTNDIEVLSVLKGNTKPGPARMVSGYCPYPGEEFLMFAHYENDQIYKGYSAVEDYRIVPMSRNASTNDYVLTKQFPGKTLHEKIQLILSNRLKELNDELAPDNEEKKLLEMNMSSNAPLGPLPGVPIHIINGRNVGNQ